MTIRRSMGALAVVAIALLGAACSSGDDEGSDTTTTAAEDASSTPDETTTTLNDDEYATAIDEYSAQLSAAGSELCDIIEVQTAGTPPDPANSAQVEKAVGIYVQLLRAYAEAFADDATSAAAFNTAADDLAAEAKEAGYPADFVSGQTEEELPKALTTEEFTAATTAFSQRAQTECAPPVPEGAEDPTTDGPATTVAP